MVSRNYLPFAPGVRPGELTTPQGDVFKQPGPPPPQGPRPHDPYALPPGTPRPGPEQIHMPSRQSPNLPDPYSQQPGTPRPPSVDAFGQGMRTGDHVGQMGNRMAGGVTPTSEDNADPYVRPVGTPRQPSTEDPYASGPSTPVTPGTPGEQFANRPGQAPFPGPGPRMPGPFIGMNRPDHFSPPNSGPPTPSGEGFPRLPGPPRTMPADIYSHQPGTPHPLSAQQQEEDMSMQPQQQQMMQGGQQFIPDSQAPVVSCKNVDACAHVCALCTTGGQCDCQLPYTDPNTPY